jgi:bifunctional oligoribonuclease and PAP phosphatase NrnA
MQYPGESASIRDAIRGAHRILAISHANPDADAVASLLSFKRAFESDSRSIDMVLGAGTVPETLVYLNDLDAIKYVSTVSVHDYDLVVFLDSASQDRVGDEGDTILEQALERGPVINIDHHVTNTRYGTIDLIDPQAAATCEILLLLYEDLEISIDEEMANILMSGIQGDTLGLRTPSTTGRTLTVSARLLDAGADLDTIVDYLFRIRPYSTLKLWAHALSAAQFKGKLIWTEITREMLEDAGADESEAEGIVNFLAGTRGARAAAMLYCKPDGWRVSMRSITDDVDVSHLSGLFGGGGHSRAAGCSLNGDISVRDEFLNTIADRLQLGSGTTAG